MESIEIKILDKYIKDFLMSELHRVIMGFLRKPLSTRSSQILTSKYLVQIQQFVSTIWCRTNLSMIGESECTLQC